MIVAGFTLENDRVRAHIDGVASQRSHLLDVTVTHTPPRWEWDVSANGESIANGFEKDRVAAKFKGYSAMFMLLASGWNSSPPNAPATP